MVFSLFTKPVVEVDATRRHLQEQVSLYGDQSLVNLVDQQGYEKPVKEAYERYLAKVSVLRSTGTLLTASRLTCLKSNISISISIMNASICDGIVLAF